jgi:hypothetical protein
MMYADGEIIESGQQDTTWLKIRQERDGVLKRSDWRANSDVEMAEEWRVYRQFLRDLPQNHFDESDEPSQGANAADDSWVEYQLPED